MDERVKSYINEQKKKQKERVLKSIGLVEREYAPNNKEKSNNYPHYDYKTQKAYRENVIDISDEDYAELLKWIPIKEKQDEKNINKKTEKKKISGWYTYSIILLILSIIGFFILLFVSIDEEDWIFFGIGVGELIMFSLFCGIVQLLSKIKQGIDNLKQ